MNLQEFKQKALSDPKFREIYHKSDLPMDVSLNVMEARIRRGMTQEELAKKIGTKQSSIARLENGDTLPSLRFLKKIADALGTDLIPPTFSILHDSPSSQQYEVFNHQGEELPSSGYKVNLFQLSGATTNIIKDINYAN